MYHHLAGILSAKTPGEAIVEAGGVGYQLRISLHTYETLPAAGQPVKVLTHLHVTDDNLALYGFATERERAFFRQLIGNVKGVGPRVALAVLSGGRVEHLQQAIRLGDVATLKAIKGVGEATAKRIVLELGKILVKQAETKAPQPAEASPKHGKKGKAATAAELSAATLSDLDEMTDLAVKAVTQLNEVPSDVALRSVQRAIEDLRNEGAAPESVQDLIRRALPYAE